MAFAKLDIGVQIDSNSVYYTKWKPDDRLELKTKIWEDIDAKVPKGIWASWENLKLDKPHLSEAEIQDEINKALLSHKADATRGFDLQLAGAEPHCVKYVWRNGERICVHCYSLEVSPKDADDFTLWEVTHAPGGSNSLTVALKAEFSWPSEA